jgi:type II secretory pathway pseudopilin PulG
MHPRASFTLIELLVVIGIVAVISVVVVLTLNPAQLLRQARDSNRLSDLNTLTKAVSLYETDQPGGSLGTASTTYFSIVDPAATSTQGTDCANTGLTPPSGWAYRCAASSSLRKTDGTGWVPVNFDQMSFKALAALPVDPTNTTSSGLYYSYTPGGSFALTATLESDKYLTTKAKEDGGYDPGRLEMGSNLALVARSQGLVGWWRLDEESGTRNDSAGTNHLTDNNTVTQAAGKVGNAAQFTRTNSEYLSIADNPALSTGDIDFTICAWAYFDSIGAGLNRSIAAKWGPGGNGEQLEYALIYAVTPNRLRFSVSNGGAPIYSVAADSLGVPATNTWYFVCGWHDAFANTINIMVDNGSVDSTSHTVGVQDTTYAFAIGRTGEYNGDYMDGRIDEVRIYKRVLTAAEIEAIYNATK